MNKSGFCQFLSLIYLAFLGGKGVFFYTLNCLQIFLNVSLVGFVACIQTMVIDTAGLCSYAQPLYQALEKNLCAEFINIAWGRKQYLILFYCNLFPLLWNSLDAKEGKKVSPQVPYCQFVNGACSLVLIFIQFCLEFHYQFSVTFFSFFSVLIMI